MPPAKKKRTKCFTGCWTCRARRVKCDEEKPSCLRCRRMGVQCEGYGVKLAWVPYNPHADIDDHESVDDSPKGPRESRRPLAPLGEASSVARMSSPKLDASLAQIDEWSPGASSELAKGSFSVFSVDLRQCFLGTAVPVPSASDQALQPQEYGSVPAGTPVDLSAIPLADTPGQATPAPDRARFQSLGLSLEAQDIAQPSPDQYRAPSLLVDKSPAAQIVSAFQPHYQGRGELDGASEHNGQETLRQRLVHPSPRQLDALPMPSKQKRLIHHWITFTSRNIVLLDEPHNPCRTMMLPMALRGLVSKAGDSNANVAIFHAICSAAAYNLFELGGRTTEQDHVLALDHDGEAIRHLRHNLALADEHQDQSCAMAIMACIAVEAVSGTTQRWRTHVSGGLAYLARLQARGVDEAALSAFRQHMVKMAILCDFPVPGDLKSFLDDEDGAESGLEFTFPYYGVSKATLQAHDRISKLAAAPPSRTPATEKDLDALELQLYLQFPGLPQQPCSSGASWLNAVVVHHTSTAFYYAGLVFFQKSIRRSPVAAVQDLVELGVQELENIEVVGGGRLGCMMMWPALVLGAECSTAGSQQRMRAWFQSQRRLGFRNLVVLEDLITSLWGARGGPEGPQEEVDWRDLIAQPRFDVFRL